MFEDNEFDEEEIIGEIDKLVVAKDGEEEAVLEKKKIQQEVLVENDNQKKGD